MEKILSPDFFYEEKDHKITCDFGRALLHLREGKKVAYIGLAKDSFFMLNDSKLTYNIPKFEWQGEPGVLPVSEIISGKWFVID